MPTIHRKRIEIVLGAAQRHRLLRLLDDLEVTGYTILPVMGGRGESGDWSRDGQVSVAGEKIMVICITSAERADAVVEAVHRMIAVTTGVLCIADVEVVRGQKF